MLNNQVPQNTSADALSQISSYFTVVDNAVQMGDTNKRYSITPQSSYAPSPPIQANSFTNVIISPVADNTADLYNGFINAQMEITVNIGNDVTSTLIQYGSKSSEVYSPYWVWVGFKDAMDAIEKYEICANGITIYTQNFAIEESFITACGVNDVVKKADIFSKVRHKDVWSDGFGRKCGCCIDLGGRDAGSTETFTIPLKIDLRRFLPLSNIRYLPAFAGKIELRLYFGVKGLLYCPQNPENAFKKNYKLLSTTTIPWVTNEFRPINERITMITSVTQDESTKVYTLTAGDQTLTVNGNYVIKQCQSIVPCFGIANNIYQSLVERYSATSLTFPTQTLAMFPCSNKLDSVSAKSTQTVTPRFIDSIFILFPKKATHHNYFKNPGFKSFYLNCGGYGNLPSTPFATINDPCFIEYCQNAMNVNGETVGFNKEVTKSLINSKYYNIIGNKSEDRSSFFIGLPTETDNTFQQGQTSNTPITYEINVTQEDNDDSYMKTVEVPPIMCFLVDSTFSIQIQPNGMPPLVEMGAYDITSPVQE